MKKIAFIGIAALLVLGITKAGMFYWRNLRGVGPAISKPKQDISQLITAKPGENTTGFPLKLPSGFSIGIYAKNLKTPRDIIMDDSGNLLVSIPSAGKVILLKPDMDGNGESDKVIDLITDLNQPHGLEIRENSLSNTHPIDPYEFYIAESNQLAVYDYYSRSDPPYISNRRKILDLPSGGNHVTRSLVWDPSGELLISIGSSCNVCQEKDQLRAKILSLNLKTGKTKVIASGMRNAVFMVRKFMQGNNDEIWATEMGRDLIGDDIPPDEINIVQAGKNYGWPYCYGKQMMDPFNKNQQDCSKTEPAFIDLQAHSAPLGLAFVPDSWPEEYRHDLLVAFHGSWNRTQPTGYKIVRIPLDENGQVEGETQDFITGWLTNKNEVLGRPVDLFTKDDGSLLISDDKAGVAYLLTPPKN